MGIRTIKFCGKYLFGDGAIEGIGDLCQELGLKGNALLVTGPTSWNTAGRKISESLKEHGFIEVENLLVKKGAVFSEVNRIREKIQFLKPSVVFGIGGGANMDLAKLASSREGVGCITVPTTFATDAMSTHDAVIWNETMSSVFPPVRPMMAVVVDSHIIRNAPWRFQAAGFADYVGKLCALFDWKLAYQHGKEHIFSEYGYALAMAQCDWLVKNAVAIRKMEERAFSTFLQILMSDGFLMEMAGNPRVLYGSEHIVSEALDREYSPGMQRPLHGETVALGTILMTYWQEGDWELISRTFEEVDAPITADQIHYDRKAIIRSLMNAATRIC
jgi:glycerol-1-phosphate dehydrogenase [NAD(P)+]